MIGTNWALTVKRRDGCECMGSKALLMYPGGVAAVGGTVSDSSKGLEVVRRHS